MKKTKIFALCALMLCFGTTVSSTSNYQAQRTDMKLNIDNYNCSELEQKIVIIKDKAYLPVNDLLTYYGKTVQWDEAARTINVFSESEPLLIYSVKNQEGQFKSGYFNRDGKIITAPIFKSLYIGLTENIIPVKVEEDVWRFIKPDGTYLFEESFKFAAFSGFNEGFASVITQEGNCAYVSVLGHIMEIPEAERLSSFSNGFGIVNFRDGSYNFIDKNGSFLLEKNAQECLEFVNDYAPVEYNNKWGIVDRTGAFVIDPIYDNISKVKNGYIFAELNNQSIVLNSDLKSVINSNEYKVVSYNDGVFTVTKDRKYGYVDVKGYSLGEIKYRHASDFRNGLAVVCDDELDYYLMTLNGSIANAEVYDYLEYLEDDYYLAADTEGEYIIDSTGEVLTSKYDEDEIVYFHDGIVGYIQSEYNNQSNDETIKYIDLYGNEIVPLISY